MQFSMRNGDQCSHVALHSIDLLAHQIASPEASGQQHLGEVSGRPVVLCNTAREHAASRRWLERVS